MSSRFCPKLVALDLDGTLLSSTREVSARTRRALQRAEASGIKLVLCTGRPPRYTRALAAELRLDELVITYNGASVCNFRGGSAEHLYQLDAETASQVIHSLRAAHPEVMTGLETPHGWYLDSALYRARHADLTAGGLHPDGYGDVLDFISTGAIKLLFRHPTLTVRDLVESIRHLNVYATWSHESLLEVQHVKVNKQVALEHVTEQLGVAAHEVAAFGDQNNDQQMLRWAGCGVAMANGCPEALAAADLTTSSNDDDGVARVLETWL